jgi:leader peptidase (prepilin peptidase)/N-methyltransferase
LIVFCSHRAHCWWIVNLLADVLPDRRKKVSTPTCPACGQHRSAIQSLGGGLLLATGARPAATRYGPIRRRVGAGSLFAYCRLLCRSVGWCAGEFHFCAVVVTVTDFEHRNSRSRDHPAIDAALVSPLWFGPGWYLALVGGAIGYGFFWLAVQLGNRFLGRGAMGWGDVKLAAFVGLITGFPGIITALVVTIIAGGVISLVLLLTRIVNLHSGIPYGPFICLGGFITMLYGQQIIARFSWIDHAIKIVRWDRAAPVSSEPSTIT